MVTVKAKSEIFKAYRIRRNHFAGHKQVQNVFTRDCERKITHIIQWMRRIGVEKHSTKKSRKLIKAFYFPSEFDA